MNSTAKAEYLQLLEEQVKRKKATMYKRRFSALYDWQLEFIERTADYFECCLCAGNQIGKTFTGTYIDAIHLLGDYPDEWNGHRFDRPPLIWCLGF